MQEQTSRLDVCTTNTHLWETDNGELKQEKLRRSSACDPIPGGNYTPVQRLQGNDCSPRGIPTIVSTQKLPASGEVCSTLLYNGQGQDRQALLHRLEHAHWEKDIRKPSQMRVGSC